MHNKLINFNFLFYSNTNLIFYLLNDWKKFHFAYSQHALFLNLPYILFSKMSNTNVILVEEHYVSNTIIDNLQNNAEEYWD